MAYFVLRGETYEEAVDGDNATLGECRVALLEAHLNAFAAAHTMNLHGVTNPLAEELLRAGPNDVFAGLEAQFVALVGRQGPPRHNGHTHSRAEGGVHLHS